MSEAAKRNELLFWAKNDMRAASDGGALVGASAIDVPAEPTDAAANRPRAISRHVSSVAYIGCPSATLRTASRARRSSSDSKLETEIGTPPSSASASD